MPASSDVSKPTSRFGSLCLGSLDKTAASEPGASLLAHPPAFTVCVSLISTEPANRALHLQIRYIAERSRLITLRSFWKCLGSGDPPGLQNRWSFLTGDGVFDSHALPPKLRGSKGIVMTFTKRLREGVRRGEIT